MYQSDLQEQSKPASGQGSSEVGKNQRCLRQLSLIARGVRCWKAGQCSLDHPTKLKTVFVTSAHPICTYKRYKSATKSAGMSMHVYNHIALIIELILGSTLPSRGSTSAVLA